VQGSSSQKRRRHVPQHGANHVYWSETANGKVFEVRDRNRKYHKVGTRLDEAKAEARRIYDDGTPTISRAGMKLDDVIAEWRQGRSVRPASAETFDCLLRLYIEPRFGRKKVREIDKGAIVAWLNGLEGQRKPLSSGSKRLILATLELVLQYAVDPLGALSVNPVRQIDHKRKPKQGDSRRRILSGDEEQRLHAYCAPFPWLRPIITVALHEALRLGEVLALQWEDVDFARNRLHVRHSLGRDRTLGPPKGGKAATIELTPAAREALLELRQDSDGSG
jgi:integrase